MGRFTIWLLRKIQPEKRLVVAAYLFWLTIFAGVYCTAWVAKDAFEKVLMAISWGAITFTALDIVLTADVRDSKK